MIKLTENIETLTNLVNGYKEETALSELEAIACIMNKVRITTTWEE